jgi:hypothetical protein
MLKGTTKSAFFFHSVKTWLLLFSEVAGCLTKKGTALHFLKHPLLRFSPLIRGGYHGEKGQWFLSNVKLWGFIKLYYIGGPCASHGFGLPGGTFIPINVSP